MSDSTSSMPASEVLAFAERRVVAESSWTRGEPKVEHTAFAGMGLERLERERISYQWRPLPLDRFDDQALPRGLREAARAHGAVPKVEGPSFFAPLAEALRAAAPNARLDVQIHDAAQQVCAGPADEPITGTRRFTLLELRVHLEAHGGVQQLWRARAARSPEELLARTNELEALVRQMVQTLQDAGPMEACPTGRFPVVFPPGAASGAFFHELCGHPLEADVVARRGSFLARRLGEQVGQEWLSVSDDPTLGTGVQLSFDDQGTPAQGVSLLRGGKVDGALTDVRTARALGAARNGHGRRVTFRHHALPRMSHTQVAPHRGTEAELVAQVQDGILLEHLVPRHMNLLSGDFSFYVLEARRIRDGRPGPFLSQGILRGNGVEALGAIDAVGGESRTIFTKRGCRKLDHGPLYVSFGQPAVRFKGLWLEPDAR